MIISPELLILSPCHCQRAPDRDSDDFRDGPAMSKIFFHLRTQSPPESIQTPALSDTLLPLKLTVQHIREVKRRRNCTRGVRLAVPTDTSEFISWWARRPVGCFCE
jgi:hypothetical protein